MINNLDKIPKYNNAKMIKNPTFSSLYHHNFNLKGRKGAIMRDPSSGGMGIKLKMARIRLISINFIRKMARMDRDWSNRPSCSLTSDKKLSIKLAITANVILLKGPANATQSMAFSGFLK